MSYVSEFPIALLLANKLDGTQFNYQFKTLLLLGRLSGGTLIFDALNKYALYVPNNHQEHYWSIK